MHVTSGAGALLVVLLAAGSVEAQFTLTLADGATRRGTPAGVDAEGRLLWRTGDKTEAVVRADVVGFESDEAEVPPAQGGVRVELTTGDALFGRIEDGPADELRLTVAGLGGVGFPLDDVAVIWSREGGRGDAVVELPGRSDDDDRVFVEREGGLDALPGTVERVTKAEVVLSRPGGERRSFVLARDRVLAVQFATEASTRARERSAIVRLRDGSRASGALASAPGGGFLLKLAAGPVVPLDLAHVKGVSFQSGAFSYLSDATPAAYVAKPYVAGGITHPLIKDRGARPGDPLRIGEERFAKGLLMFASAEATYPLDGVARFTAKVGVDPATKDRTPAGSATLVCFVDGVEKWRSPVLRAGAAAIPAALDLKGAKELRLVAEFADSYDVGARVVLGSPMLFK